MSIEALIFLFIFILLPLFEWVTGVLRQRREQQARPHGSLPTRNEDIRPPGPPASPAEPRRRRQQDPGVEAAQTRPAPERREPVRARARPVPPEAMQPQTTGRQESAARPVRETAKPATVPGQTPDVLYGRAPDHQPPTVRPAVAARAGVAARELAPRLRDPVRLREAIVLSTILGPCRANEPYGGA